MEYTVTTGKQITAKTTSRSNRILIVKAVDEGSATIPGETGIPLDVDHVGMNKFESEQDNDYKLVKVELDRMVERVLEGF